VPPLGVGLVYWPELHPLFEDPETVGVLELELQAFWQKVATPHGWIYEPNRALLARIARLPQAKLLHGVGQPLGGTVDDPLDYLPLWREAIDLLDPPWVSEHLSFSRVRGRAACREAGFLLPPRQSVAGVAQAARNITRMQQALARPLAFETGVSYLRPRADELVDGEFFGAVAGHAQCGILLDVHNLWCNERNGRQRISELLEQIPLDRVWEMHVAGGMALDGYWLDAHSDCAPSELIELAAQIVPRLPNLGAIVFEILPEHLSRIGIDGIHRQIELLQQLWRRRASRSALDVRHPDTIVPLSAPAQRADDELIAWECGLVHALDGNKVLHSRFAGLECDPGVTVLRTLIGDARRSNLARAVRYSMMLLLTELGRSETEKLLQDYFAHQAPDTFPAIEADRFVSFLCERRDIVERVAYLAEILSFEHALVRATLYGQDSKVIWSTDPVALLCALDEGRRPGDLPRVRTEMHIHAHQQ
jgi:uncharacterized protein (UPF0276 family)